MPTKLMYTDVLPNAYYDSVTLMKYASELQALEGIDKVALMMGTPANRTLMGEQGLWDMGDVRGGPTDLCVAIQYENAEMLSHALTRMRELLAGKNRVESPRASAANAEVVWSWKESAAILEEPKIALISVPGTWASVEARQALDEGFHVFLYSDNVSVEDEVSLKRKASQDNLIVMGPDCGTAWLGGVPFGFVNRLIAGSVGIIAASGTGAQEVSSALSRVGVGVSHIIGIGSRDLSAEVGGMSFQTALRWLLTDPNTQEIAIVAKPPDRDTLSQVSLLLQQATKPITALFLTAGIPPHIPGVITVSTIGELVGQVTHQAMETPPNLPRLTDHQMVRGLFAGGTLAIQASYILDIPEVNEGHAPWLQDSHVIVDLGDDHFTVGRPHPMLDGTYRAEALQEVLADGRTGLVLGDLVLGDGAEQDPAAHLVAAVKAAQGRRNPLPTMVFSVVGTADDPQGYEDQVARLRAVGMYVTQTSTAAAFAVKKAMGGERA